MLFQVFEMLQQALHTLPDTADFDSKLMVPTELFENAGKSSQEAYETDPSVILDDMMCNIVDQL